MAPATALKMRIGGSDVASRKTYDKVDPVKGDVVAKIPDASVEDARKAVDAAEKGFAAWSQTPLSQRRQVLWKAAELLEARAQDISATMIRESGCTFGWGMFNTFFAASLLREAAASVTQITGEVIPTDVPGLTAMSIRQPVGVVLGIAPWNAPVILGVRAVAMPLACGNAVIMKASEETPITHRTIGEVLEEAGLPAGAINVLTTSREGAAPVVNALIADPRVRRINFTGSTKVGKLIAQEAAKYLKPVLLELGGKAPQVVLEDADLDEAAAAANFGGFMHQGQICMATDRLVVQEKVLQPFVAKLAARAGAMKVGDPSDQSTVIGAMINTDSANRVRKLIKDAVAKGAKIALGGADGEGPIVHPTILTDVTPKMEIYHEEIFGPVLIVLKAKDDADAVRIANDTPYGLSAAVFSADINRAYGLAAQIQSGICHINSSTLYDEGQMPFGGVKESGYGRFGGKQAINEFTETRWITIQSGHRHYPI
ncbi:MAG TPA: aldehyde dehydrogenase [Hyphomicrobiales bacterium]|nr:aldehyde dehydrogenase [Hyphomicrobiales bacterium]